MRLANPICLSAMPAYWGYIGQRFENMSSFSGIASRSNRGADIGNDRNQAIGLEK